MKRLLTSWPADRLKDIAAVNGQSLSANTDLDYEFDYLEISNVNYFGVIDPNAIERLRYEDAPSRARRKIQKNSTVISSVRPNLQAVAFFPEAENDYICSTGFNVVLPHAQKLDPHFAYFFLISENTRHYFESTAKGVGYPAVDDKDFNSLLIPLPPLPEQKRIAAYLDASCRAIDAAVEVKRRQAKILDGALKSVIHNAVTKGIDPTAKTKKSGVEWFDDVPEHWEVDRLKDVVATNKDAIKVGPFGSDLMLSDMVDEGIKVYNQRTVIDQDFMSGTFFITPEKYESMKAFTVYKDDLLITTRGTIGRCVIVPASAQLGILHPCLMRVQTKNTRLLPEYLAILIQDCGLVLRQLQMMSASTTIDVIYSDSLKRTYLPLPPIQEQRNIIDFISRKNREFYKVIVHIEAQISSLVAYRKSLIHECVTGQRRITEQDLHNLQERMTFDDK